jgi:hypothetical protein
MIHAFGPVRLTVMAAPANLVDEPPHHGLCRADGRAELGERGAAGEQSSHGVKVRRGAASDQPADLPGQNRRHARDGGGFVANRRTGFWA